MRVRTAVVLGAALLLAGSTAAVPVEQRPRQVVVYPGPGRDEQLRLLAAAREGLAERDMTVVTAPNRRVTPVVVELMGRDGHTAARFGRVVQPAELFALVDAMPMRAAELRARR